MRGALRRRRYGARRCCVVAVRRRKSSLLVAVAGHDTVAPRDSPMLDAALKLIKAKGGKDV